ncbi:predicted protein [Chaetomium globosum CBS 148.51]|uniref:Rhodanese domain-containing protein n=1 Tax=Chaetomium globosum (strain ATCC 6205 / CBS 148.51 / DSM 1962 / NBRC 6347 / NRRL 1970) TaxID=306901 RepID=Q2GYM9_CHAGB|nr:uncharacterized protein CHGG_06925 [Chaetomium globosum CBS 148.51]EAQ85672.1 predicted protein [Chaetomium globosum CBS 148.51]
MSSHHLTSRFSLGLSTWPFMIQSLSGTDQSNARSDTQLSPSRSPVFPNNKLSPTLLSVHNTSIPYENTNHIGVPNTRSTRPNGNHRRNRRRNSRFSAMVCSLPRAQIRGGDHLARGSARSCSRRHRLRSGTLLLVDLRRNDFEGGTIRSSLNIPAQSLPLTLSAVYATFKAAGLRKVIFYCGSSKGRGSRAAGWLADHIAEAGDKDTQSLALEGGIQGVGAGGRRVCGMGGGV